MALPGNAWPDDRIRQMCALLAAKKSFSEIAEEMGVTRKSIASRVKRLRNHNDPRLPADRPLPKRLARPVPKDFADHAHLLSEVLERRYDVGRSTIARWRRAVGMQGRTEFKPKVIPDNFAAVAPALTMAEARALYGVADELLRRWEAATGVKLRRLRVVLPAGRLKMDRDNRRDMSRAGLAADYLRRFGPVFRCDQHGKPSDKGTHWARGRYVLTGAEIIDRAERNGWQPDAWRAVATPTTTEGARA